MSYRIGESGVPWGEQEKSEWLSQCQIQRSYQAEVVDPIYRLSDRFHVERYGALELNPLAYPLFALKSVTPSPHKPWVLLTGGVHGYETSGVQGALAFLDRSAKSFEDSFNFVVLPCVSPWGYETINRWNPLTLDPNRSFKDGGLCEEAFLAMRFLDAMDEDFLMHMDLHETTDTDESEFRPALSAKLGKAHEPTIIPDGFYLVGDRENPQDEFHAAIINAVAKCTHIAPCDDKGRLLGDKASQFGVVNYAVKELGLCAGLTAAPFTTTTEVYPDSPSVSSEDCIDAQVVAVEAALNYVR